jgi:2-oxoglutarate dehydrogenase E2 component (dihydrolipoamide succinyltransferase)
VNSEIPSPVAGILTQILATVNEEVEVGAPLAVIQVGEVGVQGEAIPVPEKTTNVVNKKDEDASLRGFYSPAVLQIAMQEGIPLNELENILGTGQGGRLTKKDLEAYQKSQERIGSCSQSASKQSVSQVPLISSSATSSKMKITGLRKAIADNMLKSYKEVPHAAIVNEVDVTALVKLIQREKEKFHSLHGAKLTITSFLAKAVANAVAKYPLVNASVDLDTIIVKHAVNVGIAVGVEQGVIVPVIKQCELKDLPTIAKSIADLSSRTRSGKLTHEEVTDGTITITNFGMAGARMGFPIIRFPEVAIIGIGAIQKRVMVMEDDSLAIRQMVDLTFCFDHRVIDGLYGCAFLNAMMEELQNPQSTL